LAVLLAPSAWGKLTGDERQIGGMRAIGFPLSKLWLLAGAEIAGILGVLVGLFWWPAGVLASIGLIGFFVGALIYLVRARVTAVRPLASAGGFLLLTLAVLVLQQL
jgi:uncharacterized membrane protein YphA (DoxX/SURF4 family)